MKRTYRFYKDDMGWFIDLKYWMLNRGYLAMVLGADEMLETLSVSRQAMGKKDIRIQISTKPFKGYEDVLTRTEKIGLFKGSLYRTTTTKFNDIGLGENTFWLCPVTLVVFGRYPKKIYIKTVN